MLRPFRGGRGGWIGRPGGVCELVHQELVLAEAGVTLAAIRIEDPERRPTTWRAIAVTGHHGLRPLADDVAPQPDPRPSGELQPEGGGLSHGVGQVPGATGWLEDDERGLRPAGKGRQAAEAIGDG